MFPALNSYGASTVFIVWKSMPGVDGSSMLRIAECPPGAALTPTGSEVATPFSSEIDEGLLNVPSFPTQLRSNVRGPVRPPTRVIVYVRVYGTFAVTPSRS